MTGHVHLHEMSEARVSDNTAIRHEVVSRVCRMRCVLCRGLDKREEVADRSGGPKPASYLELEERAMGSGKAQLGPSSYLGRENSADQL